MYAIVLVFDSVGADQYWAVNEQLGIDRDGRGDWPDGIVSHAGGPTADGGWLVSEVWESRADQEQFMAGRLGKALADVGVPAPTQVIDSDLEHHHS